MSSFKSTSLFDSGPHVMLEVAAGQDIVPRLRLGNQASGNVSIGDAQLVVLVTGRLIGIDDEDLWTQIDTIKTELAAWQTAGKLIDNHGHEWPVINFVRFEPAAPFDRGRDTSIAYTATFMKV